MTCIIFSLFFKLKLVLIPWFLLLLQGRVRRAVGVIRSDVVAPSVHLVQHPIRLQYGLAMAARLGYFTSQQAIVSATVDGKRSVDPLALGRAVVAALGTHGLYSDVYY